MTAVFPLRTDTDKFDGGSGAAIKIISLRLISDVTFQLYGK